MPKVQPQTKQPLRGGTDVAPKPAVAQKPKGNGQPVAKAPAAAPAKPAPTPAKPVASTKPKATTPAKPTVAQAKPKAKPSEDVFPVLYPKLDIMVCCVGKDEDFRCRRGKPLTCDDMKSYLGWEPLSEYKARMRQSDDIHEGLGISYKEMTDDQFDHVSVFDADRQCVIEDANGEPVCCWNNRNNRSLQEAGYKKYAQDILNRGWAGPNTMTGEVELPLEDGTLRKFPKATVNGEPIIISRTGQCQSIQHRGIGFVIACQMWANSGPDRPGRNWRELWPEEPVFETTLVLGTSDDDQVVATLDNVIPRTEADVIFTGDTFRGLSRPERKLKAAMLASARDLLWTRTGAGQPGAFAKYLTNTTKQQFFHAHPKLKDCVNEMYSENAERAFSNHRLSPGQCAGIMYLMGSSSSDGDEYRNDVPRCEEGNTTKGLDWTNWEGAVDFFQLLATGFKAKEGTVDRKPVQAVVDALVELSDSSGGVGARSAEKQIILARAWAEYAEDDFEEFTEAVRITDDDWQTDQNGNRVFVPQEPREFGGIDIGPKINVPKSSGTAADVEADKAEKREAIAKEAEANARKHRVTQEGKTETLAEEAARVLAERNAKKVASGKQLTRRDVEAEQTARAALHDEEDAEAGDDEDVVEDELEESDEAE